MAQPEKDAACIVEQFQRLLYVESFVEASCEIRLRIADADFTAERAAKVVRRVPIRIRVRRVTDLGMARKHLRKARSQPGDRLSHSLVRVGDRSFIQSIGYNSSSSCC